MPLTFTVILLVNSIVHDTIQGQYGYKQVAVEQ